MDHSTGRHSPLAGVHRLLVLCTLAVTALAGCGGGGGGGSGYTTVSGATPPTITTQPQNSTVTTGQTATFTVAATGTTPMTYQWMRNATAISGATSTSYTTPATSSSDNGSSFTVMVSNSAGSATSSAAILTVSSSGVQSESPQITAQPQSATVTAGQTATFSVTATGSAPLSYQWLMNSAPISGATSASYTTPATTTGDSGESFTVTVSNSAGSVTSSAASLTVDSSTQSQTPQITAQPQSATVTVGQTAVFSVAATGTAPLSYQWMMNSTAISGATSASYTTPTTTMSNSGESFAVKVSNSVGSATSNAATLTVKAAMPQITAQPQNATVTAGQTATFSVTATGTAPLSYQWMMDSTAISGATSASYTTPATTTSNSGESFSVKVTNSAGSATSGAATLTVNGATLPAAATPTFSLAAGVYSSTQTVTLACATASSTIYYTVNGTPPTTSSSVYSAAISVSATETLEAICTATGYSNSAVATATYTISSSLYSLPANRVTTWMPGLSYAPTSGIYAPKAPPTGWAGGIPTNYTQYGSTYSPSGNDDTSAINTLLSNAGAAASATAPKLVKLACGHFIISGDGLIMTSSYVELVGCGPGPGMRGALVTSTYVSANASTATMLVKTDGSPNPVVTIGCAIGSGAGAIIASASSASTGDMVAGTNTTTLSSPSSVSGMAVGEMVYVDELWDPTISWINTLAGQGSGYLGWGEGGNSSTTAGARAVGQAMEVSSFNATTGVVTFTTPFAQTYRASHSAHLIRISPSCRTNWSGIANLFVSGGAGGDGGGQVYIASGMYDWVDHIEASGHDGAQVGGSYGGSMVHFVNSFRGELRDSYLHGDSNDTTVVEPGGSFYNIVLDSFTSDTLVENNISWFGNKVIVMRTVGSGNVVGYNYMDDGYGYSYLNQMETGINQNHMVGSHHTLFEGNYSWQLGSESRWGNTNYATWFRNWGSGMRVSAWPSLLITSSSCAYQNPLVGLNSGGVYYEDGFNRNPIKASSYSFNYNYVGNVLGYTGNPLLSSPKSSGAIAQTGTSYEQYGPSTPSNISNAINPEWTMGVPDGSEGNVTVTGSISATTFDITGYPGGQQTLVYPGLGVSGGSVAAGTYISAFQGSSVGGAGDYTVNNSQTAGSASLTIGYYGNGLNQVVLPSTLRDANFDYYTGSVHWHGVGGSGTSETTPPGASASGGSTLPNSLYMTSKPAWFGSSTWPWVDGSNATNPIPGALPAMARFQSCAPNTIQ